jgi:hypothetical protein
MDVTMLIVDRTGGDLLLRRLQIIRALPNARKC